MEKTIIEINTDKKPNKVYQAIDSFFHLSERKTTLKSEIGAGCSGFLVAISSFILNAYVIGSVYGNYAGSYLAISLLAFLGTFLLGFLTNRPLIQCSNLALASSLVSMISAYNGLTYSNMMMITFLSSLLYLVLVLTKAGKKIVSMIPLSVRKALPIGVGLFTMMEAFSYSGLTKSEGLQTIGEFSMQGSYLIMMAIAIFVYIAFRILKVRKSALHIFLALIGLMWAFGIIFFSNEFIGGQTAATIVYQRLNVFVSTDGASPYNIALGFKSIQWFDCFTKGFDFTALMENGGSPFLVILKGIITFLCLTLATNDATLKAVAVTGGFADEKLDVKEAKRVHLISSVSNVVAPLIGAPIQSVDSQSGVMTNDEAKTGLSSLVCSLGFFICLFTWFFFGIFATETHGVGMWIEQSEVKLASYVQDVFAFSCLIVALASSRMLVSIKDVSFKEPMELLPFIVTLVGIVIFKDIALGMAAGILTNFLFSLISKDGKNERLQNGLFSLASVVYLIFAIL